MVLQDPESQIITDKVWHDLAFGLENIGISNDEIRLRVGEMANYFGINQWFHQKTDSLSGGQKQLLNLAAVLLMQLEVLILDEPTSQLDPIAASEFVTALKKVNIELGITVILAEHRLEEVFPAADKILVMEEGKKVTFDVPRTVGKTLGDCNHIMKEALPSAMRIYGGLHVDTFCPVNIREGKDSLSKYFKVFWQDYKRHIGDG